MNADPITYAHTLKLLLDLPLYNQNCEVIRFFYQCKNVKEVSEKSNIYNLVNVLRSTECVVNSICRFKNMGFGNGDCNAYVELVIDFDRSISRYIVQIYFTKRMLNGMSDILDRVLFQTLDHEQILSLLELLYGQQMDF